MATYTRKEFLGLGAVLAGGAAAARLPIAAAQEPAREPGRPDLVVINARVYTIDDVLPRAEAFAVRGNRFLAVGSTNDVRNLAAPETEVIDAAGMTVTPGFIDTHSHPGGVNELYGVNTNLRTVAEISPPCGPRPSTRRPAGGCGASCSTTRRSSTARCTGPTSTRPFPTTR